MVSASWVRYFSGCNGLGAGGLTLGPMAGRLLAEHALGQTTTLNLADYALPGR